MLIYRTLKNFLGRLKLPKIIWNAKILKALRSLIKTSFHRNCTSDILLLLHSVSLVDPWNGQVERSPLWQNSSWALGHVALSFHNFSLQQLSGRKKSDQEVLWTRIYRQHEAGVGSSPTQLTISPNYHCDSLLVRGEKILPKFKS